MEFALIAELLAYLTPRRVVSGLALLGGAALVLGGMTLLVLRERRLRRGVASADSGVPGETQPRTTASDPGAPTSGHARGLPGAALASALILLVLALAGAWLRIHDIDIKTLTHTEAMLPNLAWPPDSWPPARHSLYETFWWHFHSELHPPAHYLLMWGWTNLFGTSLTSLRLPSALFGVGAILVSYRIGALIHNRPVGLVAAAFVAFNGFHISNSQFARVYMMGTFLALLSTLSLLHVMVARRQRGHWEVTYVFTSLLAVYTKSFFWIVFLIQMAWIALQVDRPERLIRRVLGLQALVVMVGAPALAHQMYHGAPTDYPPVSLAFLVDFLLFGFAFLPDVLSIPERSLPLSIDVPFAALAILLLGAGIHAWTRASGGRGPGDARGERTEAGDPGLQHAGELWPRAVQLISAGSALLTWGFVAIALQRRAEMTWTVALPLLALAIPTLCGRFRFAMLDRGAGGSWRHLPIWLSRPSSLILLLAFLPMLVLLLASFHSSVLNPRGLIMFSSYLLIVAAAGAWVVGRSRLLRIPLVLALIALHTGSVLHWRHYPSESRDYRALAERMNERMQPGDRLFVVPEEHSITPLFYYLDNRGYTYVTRDYEGAVAALAGARVWLVYFESYEWGPFPTTSQEMTRALQDFRMAEEVEALRARAQLFVRSPL